MKKPPIPHPKLVHGLLCLLLLLGAQQPARAQGIATQDQPPDQAAWQINTTAHSTTLVWSQDNAIRSGEDLWSLAEINGLRLPTQLFAFAATGQTPPTLRIHSQRSRAADSRDTPAPRIIPAIPQNVDGPPRPDLAVSLPAALPDSPVTVLRQGRMRGVDVLVVAVTQRFRQDSQTRTLTAITFSLEGARPLETIPSPANLNAQPFAPAAVTTTDTDTAPSPAPLTSQTRVRVTVENAGMQEILLDDLRSMGFVKNDTPLARLQLYWAGQQIALEATADRLRFYAPPPGDRWNTSDTYWLTLGDTTGLRMANRPALSEAAANLPITEAGWESGRWSAPTLYDSTLPGADRDHWFAADLRSGPEMTTTTLTVPVPSILPPLAASATFTLQVSGYTRYTHNLRIIAAAPAPTATLLSWQGSGDHTVSFHLDSRTQQLLVATQGEQTADGVLIDHLLWRRPVALHFGYTSGAFESASQPARLRLQQVAARARLYDISDPRQPVRVLLDAPSVGSLLVESPGDRRYLLVADENRLYLPWLSGSAQARITETQPDDPPKALLMPAVGRAATAAARPQLQLAPVLDFAPALHTDAIYVAPALFHPALQPLLDHRRSQGYRVALVDVAALYDSWSGGQVAPEAIRDFVRWAAANSSLPPQALILVGDGTSDPHNYTGRNNTNFIPPYLLPIDPWLGEAACETCFGQIDGASPLDDPLPDVAVGRIPAKNVDDVTFYVEKLLGYERTPATVIERSRILFVADNYREASGRVDAAGDFAATADAAATLQPAGTQIERVYYDPWQTHTQDPWREPDAQTAWRKTLEALNRGGGFASFVGHAHHWQWASTDLNVDPPYLLGMYDADPLTNGGNLPILLEMTCLTGMFQQPAISGTTIDERLLLHTSGGAAAIWASSGLGVAFGHDTLQTGFYRQFWNNTGGDRRLGSLAQAGYLTLFADGLCCQESLRTFLILGDPLTLPQAAAAQHMWMPSVMR